MAERVLSQRTIGAVARFLPVFFDRRSDVRETLYENNFPRLVHKKIATVCDKLDRNPDGFEEG